MNPKASILVADDEEDFRYLVRKWLEDKGYWVTGVASGTEALAAIQENEYDAAVLDIKMPGLDGVQLLKRVKEVQPSLEVVMLTGHAAVDTAIAAMKLGAYDYLSKPCNMAKLELVLQKAVEKSLLVRRNQGLSAALKRQVGAEVIVGDSPLMKRLIKLVEKVADSETPVLVEGESGTGKELVAQALHLWSCRSDQPFIVVNAGALPAQLLESELFGHEKGAFTGAIAAKTGLVELAAGGTLFLDEIGEMDPVLQVKLLRFLETGEFRRVGGNRLQRVHVRVIAATNRVLEQEVAEGRFREDLYYRLNVIKIVLPPLRERREDIPLLVSFFLHKFARGERKELSETAMKALLGYHFPGNVRELANIIERGILLAEGPLVEVEDLFGCEKGWQPVGVSLKEMEKRHVAATLAAVNGDKAKAANLLGISLRHLYRKIHVFGL
ncbi:histidine kinase [Clostridiales bacterium PH28_bin88]|nr:histidine kinase [Clostridiales bacterium PH28_bin88]